MKKIILLISIIAFTLSFTACDNSTKDENVSPLAEYKFEKNLNDETGTYRLLPYGKLSFSHTGIQENCLTLQDGYVMLSGSENMRFNKNFTFAAWIKLNNLSAFNPILFGNESSSGDVAGGPFSIYLNDDYTTLQCDLTFKTKDGYKSHSFIAKNVLNPSVLLSQWRHVAISFNHGTLKMYIDGNKIYQEALPEDFGKYQDIAYNSKPYTIGRGPYHNVSCSIDDIKLYKNELSENRIADLYNVSMSNFKNKLVIKKDSTQIFINGKESTLSNPVVADHFYGKLLIPAKEFCEIMGANIVWDGDDGLGRLDLSLTHHSASFWILNSNASYDGTHTKIEPYPQTINDIGYVPLYAFLEGLGGIEQYNPEDATYTIYY